MAKVQFNARKDSVVRPRRTNAHATKPSPGDEARAARASASSDTASEATTTAAPERDSTRRRPGGPAGDTSAGGARPGRRGRELKQSVDVAPARPVKQTSVTLPAPQWQEMQALTAELIAGGRALGQNELLIAVLRYHAPATLESAAELFETYLALPGAERHAGADTEERNVKLPQEVRRRLTEQAQVLRSVTRDASRGALIAATWQLHGPRTAGEAEELLAGLRRADLDAALAAAA